MDQSGAVLVWCLSSIAEGTSLRAAEGFCLESDLLRGTGAHSHPEFFLPDVKQFCDI